jgi:Xaa-Pro dipeptidase
MMGVAIFSHGVSHILSIQLHDVGTRQLDKAGTTYVKDQDQPTKTKMQTIEVGHMFTVELGLYFMEMLLTPHRTGQKKDLFDWWLIDSL